MEGAAWFKTASAYAKAGAENEGRDEVKGVWDGNMAAYCTPMQLDQSLEHEQCQLDTVSLAWHALKA